MDAVRDTAVNDLSAKVFSALVGLSVIILLGLPLQQAHARVYREQLIPILGVTMENKPVGTVANLVVSFEERSDHNGLAVQFKNEPGRFSRMAQTAVQQAIYRSARVAGLSPDSWTVVLSNPYPGVTIYGDSLSAMVGLSVIALAKGDFIPPDRVMTGTIGPDGRIEPVGSLPLKVAAAGDAHIRRVLVPEELDTADSDWRTPFLMQVSPVGSVSQAYQALTDHPLNSTTASAPREASN